MNYKVIIDKEKLELLKKLGITFQGVEEVEEVEEFKYPMWFKSTTDQLVVKFTDLSTGEVVIPNKYDSVGHISSIWAHHTNTKHWTQVEEPEVFWEPSEGDYGWYMRPDGYAMKLSNLYNCDYKVYKTKEQAEEALEISKAEYRLKKACFELGGRGWENKIYQYYIYIELGSLYVTSCYDIKDQPSWFYLPSSEACEELINTHKQDLLLWLRR